jgi:hypothetical protein
VVAYEKYTWRKSCGKKGMEKRACTHLLYIQRLIRDAFVFNWSLVATFAGALIVSLLLAWPFTWPLSFDNFTSWIRLHWSGRLVEVVIVGELVTNNHCNAFKSSLKGAKQCFHLRKDSFSNVPLAGPYYLMHVRE